MLGIDAQVQKSKKFGGWRVPVMTGEQRAAADQMGAGIVPFSVVARNSSTRGLVEDPSRRQACSWAAYVLASPRGLAAVGGGHL